MEAVSTFEIKATGWLGFLISYKWEEIFLIPWVQDREYNPDDFNLQVASIVASHLYSSQE